MKTLIIKYKFFIYLVTILTIIIQFGFLFSDKDGLFNIYILLISIFSFLLTFVVVNTDNKAS